MKFPLTLAALLLAAPAFAQAPQAQVITLAAAQRIALANHPQIKASDYEAEAAGEDVWAARAAYFPQVSADAIRAFAGDNTRLAAEGGLNNPTVIDRGSVGVGVSQLITDFGRTNAEVDAARAELAAGRQRADLTRAEVLLGVTRAYYDVLRAEALMKVAADTVKSRQTLLDRMTELRNVKLRSDLDLSIARQSMDDADLLRLQARNSRDDAMAELSEALGENETGNFTLADTVRATPPAGTLDSFLAEALSHNPQLAALQADYKAARENAVAADRAFYPTLNAVGFAGDTPIRSSGQPIDPTYAAGGIDLSIPLFTGGRQTAEADRAEAEAGAARMRYEAARNALVRSVHTAFDSAQAAFENIAVTAHMHRNTQESLQLTQERYNIGKNSIVDLNEAQLADTRAAVAEADATYQYLIDRALLDYAAGVFSAPAAP